MYPPDYRPDLSGEDAPDYTPAELLAIRIEAATAGIDRAGQVIQRDGVPADTITDLAPLVAQLEATWRAMEARL